MTSFAVHCAPWQACAIWDHLRDALAGHASHGSEAEVYAYLLGYQDPAAERQGAGVSLSGYDPRGERAVVVGRDLAAICDAFAAEHEVDVRLDSPTGWALPQSWLTDVGGFEHRVLVRVERRAP